jgi:dolichol-phosphate mannosyltransferase
MKIVVVVPTYNERGTVEPLIAGLQDAFTRVPQHTGEILIVDDSSPDGTGDIVRELQQRMPNLHLLSGKKQGLGVAYARGLQHALHELGAHAVVHMDADFSHDPQDLPRLIAKIDEGYDLVVGARYIEGGGLSDDWGLLRRLISRTANFGARVIAGISQLHDCTNGYRAYRASVLNKVDFSEAPRGYAILTYLAYQSLVPGARLAEVPVMFSNRAHGTSKLRGEDVREFFLNAWWIRYDRRERFLRYAKGGLSSVAANIGAVALLYYVFGLPAIAASVLAIEVSLLFSIGWRSAWGRALHRRGRSLPELAMRVHLFSIPSSVLTLAAFIVAWKLSVPVVASQALAILPALVWNYFIGDRGLDLLRRRNILRDVRTAAEPIADYRPDGGM